MDRYIIKAIGIIAGNKESVEITYGLEHNSKRDKTMILSVSALLNLEEIVKHSVKIK
jgi:hypothetical protein